MAKTVQEVLEVEPVLRVSKVLHLEQVITRDIPGCRPCSRCISDCINKQFMVIIKTWKQPLRSQSLVGV